MLTRFGIRLVAVCVVVTFARSLPGLWGIWAALTGWVGTAILQLPGASQWAEAGSPGFDSSFEYVSLGCTLAIGALLAPLWAQWDRKRGITGWPGWLTIVLRYALATSMFTYGFAKVFLIQFPEPSLGTLTKRVGDLSPMGLLWTFIGYSPVYQAFGGLAEVVSGTLLLFRQTCLLGALMTTGVMLNVVMLNFCYDVPVKRFSTQILLMAVILAAPHLPRLWRALILNQAVPAGDNAPVFTALWARRASAVVKILALLLVCTLFFNGSKLQTTHPGGDPAALCGIYDVCQQAGTNWRQVEVKASSIVACNNDGSYSLYTSQVHPSTRQLLLREPASSRVVGILHYVHDANGDLSVAGQVKGQIIQAKLHINQPKRREDFLLIKRGFHWVQERPFNR
jgi:hypothetical protein